MCLETVYSILGYWNHPLMNVFGETGCHIANLLRGTGLIQQQVHSFIMATTRYIFLFHDNILLRFDLTINVSRIICLVYNNIKFNSWTLGIWYVCAHTVFTRCLMVSTDQADSSCFYFRIS